MKRMLCRLALVMFAIGVPVAGQAQDVNKVLADARAALGGEKKLSSLKTLTATGQSVSVRDNKSSAPTDVEMALEMPDKFMKKDVMMVVNTSAITRTSGFNGDQPINIIDQPPSMPGQFVLRVGGPGGPGGGPATPEQEAENRKRMLSNSRQELARLSLGFLLASLPVYPLEFSYSGQAESPDGKADVIDVKGEGGFAVKLFIDSQSHLPLMLSWMAKEPLVITRTAGGPGGPGGSTPPSGAGVAQFSTHGQPTTPEERAKMVKQMQDQAKEAEAKLRIVEYRLFYGDYREVDGIKVPFKLQRSIDGKPVEEVTFEKVKINGKVDASKFAVK